MREEIGEESSREETGEMWREVSREEETSREVTKREGTRTEEMRKKETRR